jgi:hypothetical protein
MTKKPLHVYQFKISLLEIKPLIWRRIQVVETYTFWDLHVAIQDAMGWQDYHLHEFNIIDPSTNTNAVIGIPDEDDSFYDRVVLPGWEQHIRDFFSMNNPKAKYEYDFGDGWEHDIILEAILPKDLQSKYPQCLGGARSCPPEDCGGYSGYAQLLNILKKPRHPEFEETKTWVGDHFQSENFDATQVRFDSPTKRWKLAFEHGI